MSGWHGNWQNWSNGRGGNRTPSKTILHGVIAVYTGDLDGEYNIVSEHAVNTARMAEAIDNAADVLDVFEHIVKPDNKKYKMPHGSKNIPYLALKKGTVPTKRTMSRSVACCAYNATDSYLQHWLGRKLDKNDRDWYTRHHRVTSDGLPQEYTFSVLQQLTEPYGCGIKSIQVPRNTRRFPEHTIFIKALGANPFFMVDGHTTNEEAYGKLYPEVALHAMGIKTDSAKKNHKAETFAGWRFECVDKPALGAVIMKQFSLDKTGHNGGSNYYGPRGNINIGKNDYWLMAVKFDELAKINYLIPPEIEPYQEYEGTLTYDFWKIPVGAKTLNDFVKKYGTSTYTGTSNTYSGSNTYNGSNIRKGVYYEEPLEKLGYTEAQIRLMTWGTARHIKEKNLKASEVTITTSGGWLKTRIPNANKDKKEAQLSLVPKKNEDRVLAYPPICETCQNPPGSSTFNIHDELICEHCGSELETSYVPPDYILSGWLPVEEISPNYGIKDEDYESLSDEEFEKKYGWMFFENFDKGN